jgi:hypothetical protein
VLDTPRTVYDSSQRPHQRDVYGYGFLLGGRLSPTTQINLIFKRTDFKAWQFLPGLFCCVQASTPQFRVPALAFSEKVYDRNGLHIPRIAVTDFILTL